VGVLREFKLFVWERLPPADRIIRCERPPPQAAGEVQRVARNRPIQPKIHTAIVAEVKETRQAPPDASPTKAMLSEIGCSGA